MAEHVFIRLAYRYANKHIAKREQLKKDQVQHNLMTYQAARELSHYHPLGNEQRLVLLIACCFMTGSSDDGASLLEKRVERLIDFQKTHYLDAQLSNQICVCMRNCLTNSPQTLTEQILCDAMNYPLSNISYIQALDQVDEFVHITENRQQSKMEWIDGTIQKLSSHQYFTSYAQRNFQPGLKLNLRRLHSWIRQQGLFYANSMM